MPTHVVILGMHRSGTSYLARALQAAGLYLGDNLMEANPANMEGFGESWESVKINDHILALSGGSWDRVPITLTCDPDAAEWIRCFMQQFSNQPIAGWKDPRTTLTFELWKPHLDSYHLIGAVRHPLKVARSLQIRDGLPLEQGVNLWLDYNERLLKIADEEAGRFHWFDFDLPELDVRRSVQLLAHRLGLHSNTSQDDLFNPYLRHHVQHEEIADPRARLLYERLKEYARGYPNATNGSSPCPRSSSDAPFDRQVHLDRVLTLQDAMLQKCFTSLVRCQDKLAELETQFQTYARAKSSSFKPLAFLRRRLSWLKRRADTLPQENSPNPSLLPTRSTSLAQ